MISGIGVQRHNESINVDEAVIPVERSLGNPSFSENRLENRGTLCPIVQGSIDKRSRAEIRGRKNRPYEIRLTISFLCRRCSFVERFPIPHASQADFASKPQNLLFRYCCTEKLIRKPGLLLCSSAFYAAV